MSLREAQLDRASTYHLQGIIRAIERHWRAHAAPVIADIAHAATRWAASHSIVTPLTPRRRDAAMTLGQCSGAMLSRFRICRAASYPQPIDAANSPMVGHLEMRSEIEVGVSLILHSYKTYEVIARVNRTP